MQSPVLNKNRVNAMQVHSLKLLRQKMQVDFLTLTQQYAGFLAALGGVTITVLTLVLSLDREKVRSNSHKFLVAALVVATLSSFTGAHLMAETAAFIRKQQGQKSGARLFLLASINIYLSTILTIFVLMLLPADYNIQNAEAVTVISALVFLCVVVSALCWMYLTATSRIPASHRCRTIRRAAIVSVIWLLALCILPVIFKIIDDQILLLLSFSPIVVFTGFSLLRFVITFDDGGKAKAFDISVFCLSITLSCASLLGIAVRLLLS
jgi:hypothetical protein